MQNSKISSERCLYLKKIKKRRAYLKFVRAAIFIIFILSWEMLGRLGVTDPFIVSMPSRIIKTIAKLSLSGELLYHTGVTFLEALSGFLIGTVLSIITASLLWWNHFLNDAVEPYLVILNALPKIALGPVFIVWLGSGYVSIVSIALSVSLIVGILEVLTGFLQTDKEMTKLIVSMGGSKKDVLLKVVFPSNLKNIISSLKINMGMSWVGVIVGEFLISKAGLGYLIVYGSQIFKLDLVMASVVILAFVAAAMYLFIEWLSSSFNKRALHF